VVLKCVRSHRPQRTNEEDMVQAVFVKIFHKLSQFGGEAPLEHWVSRVTINTCLKEIAYEGRRPERRWADLAVEEQAVIERLMVNEDDLPDSDSAAARDLVEKLLQSLAPADRLVVTLFHLDGQSMEEISEITGWTTNAVKVRVCRARRKMRSQLRRLR
jgi:RNA polymerase sigma-70 factor, ECF subfamily